MATLVERRRFMQALAAASAVPAAAAAQAPASSQEEQQDAAPVVTTLHDAAAATTPSYFDERQFATLQRLCDLFMPPMDGKPGALDTDVPAFLDFYVSQSPEPRPSVYRNGLDTLHSLAVSKFGKSFSDLDDGQADQIVAEPLKISWTPSLPADPLAAFLREAKADIMNATMNSRDYIEAPSSGGSRSRRRSSSLYWYTMD